MAVDCREKVRKMFKTLLVEDNLNYRGVLKSALLNRFIDLDTREAAGESDALNIVDTFDPDLIIMDIDLESGVNGLDLTRKIKYEHPGIVVVILSQHDIPEYRSVAQQNGADFFFSKSTSLKNIFDYVDSVMANKIRHINYVSHSSC
jgi:DNA-binding NarL/FixJ family response regulator